MSLILYLVLLPLSVWMLAGAFALLDGGNRSSTFRLLALRLLPVVILVWFLGKGAVLPLACALLTVLTVHTLALMGTRWALRRGLFRSRFEG
jgi:hypothetical protein